MKKKKQQGCCPNCGYCPSCGRAGHDVAPWQIPYPYQPVYQPATSAPYIFSGTLDTNFTYSSDTPITNTMEVNSLVH